MNWRLCSCYFAELQFAILSPFFFFFFLTQTQGTAGFIGLIFAISLSSEERKQREGESSVQLKFYGQLKR
ncbi:hypothetical protein RchiOBHm_Chr6g0270341 [Rosa chinensis]|uniref:Uncharacterized protein n=1 Tax=Rosa chinensis TaxID=74649 RepID=A0A2P6PQP2_ROSCH|nr:hypothetical protein RchiOBHm_Chr6g0270341 [Rosa chinensis]